MEGLRIYYILNLMHSCEHDDRECISENEQSTRFPMDGFDRNYEIYERIVQIKSRIHMVVFHNYQKILIDFVLSLKKATQWDPPFPVGSMFET